MDLSTVVEEKNINGWGAMGFSPQEVHISKPLLKHSQQTNNAAELGSSAGFATFGC
jgi:hypothetical protein